jgi:ABC-type branched-chain amino acid transport systems, ATPase component
VPISAAEPLLDIRGLEAGYGKIAVLHGVDMTIGAGEVVTLLGPQRSGQDHAAARDFRPRAMECRRRDLCRAKSCWHRPA